MTDIYLGVLSGTSMDAIDVAAFDFSSPTPKMIANLSTELPVEYSSRYKNIINTGQCDIKEFGELDHWTGEIFAGAVLKFLAANKINKQEIKAIGSHGQTLWHAPDAKIPFTLQIGDPNVIAVTTGLTTVADFRRADIAAGGKGAPFAPVFHQAVFSDPKEDRCILNIGGIANISILTNNTVTGFDPGPGNCLMDNWVKQHFNIDYDKDGEIAQTGRVSDKLLAACLSDPYFSKPAPKSTGLEYFNQQWLQTKIQSCGTEYISPTNVLTTLIHLTATCVVNAIKKTHGSTLKTFVCGGGAKNIALCTELVKQLGKEVQTTAAIGLDPAWVEAALFAWLAKQTLAGKTVDLRAVTGATKPVILGAIYGFMS